MTDSEVLTYLSKPIITWKAPKPSYRIDTKRLSLEHPELIKAYQHPVVNSRRFVITDLPEVLLFRNILEEQEVLMGVVK